MPNTKAYGEWLRRQRQAVEPRLSQARLAQVAGVSGNYIARLEGAADGSAQPIFEPHPERVDRIARALERFHRRPLVNEARAVLGIPLLAEPGEASEFRTADLVDRLERLTPEQQEVVRRLLDNPQHLEALRALGVTHCLAVA